MATLSKHDVHKLEITTIPDYAFMKGIACNDIVQLRLLSTEEKKKRKWGDPDVEIKSLWYKNVNLATKKSATEFITRKVANERFYTTDGRKLSTRYLKTNKKYIVTAPLNNQEVFVLSPSGKNVTYTINGKEIPNNVYAVFVLDGNKILYDLPILLKPNYFHSMIKMVDTPKELSKRIRRYDTASETRKQAQYRVVAMAVDKKTFQKVGYILSFMLDTGVYKEQFCNMKKLLELLENNNIRNMKIEKNIRGQKEEKLTYGRLIELPTHFVDMGKNK